jgi:hypothetical protein
MQMNWKPPPSVHNIPRDEYTAWIPTQDHCLDVRIRKYYVLLFYFFYLCCIMPPWQRLDAQSSAGSLVLSYNFLFQKL